MDLSKEKEISMSDLAEGAVNIHCLAIALDRYIFDHVSSATDVTLEDLNGLNGIVKAMLMLSEKHFDNASTLEMKF